MELEKGLTARAQWYTLVTPTLHLEAEAGKSVAKASLDPIMARACLRNEMNKWRRPAEAKKVQGSKVRRLAKASFPGRLIEDADMGHWLP